jgi:hypothetical protein
MTSAALMLPDSLAIPPAPASQSWWRNLVLWNALAAAKWREEYSRQCLEYDRPPGGRSGVSDPGYS